MKKRKSRKVRLGAYFVICPVSFLIVGYLILILAAWPIFKPFYMTLNMIISDERFDPNNGKNLTINDGLPTDGFILEEDIKFPSYGDAFGKISIDGTSVKASMYFGDGDNQLKDGVGVYNGSNLPGYGSTILVAGHNNTYFNGLKDVSIGDIININTNYGIYKYEISDIKVLKWNDKSAYSLSSSEEKLVLYTCYPFNILGRTDQRYFVYANFVSGPKIIYSE